MPQIKYADMHCDSLTLCCKGGGRFSEFNGQVNVQKLTKSGCAAQCFAIFTDGKNAAGDFEKFLAFYNAQILIDPHILPVERFSDLLKAESGDKIAAILTVENLGFLDGDFTKIRRLKEVGVKMASLVWNNANAFAYPNLIMHGGVPKFGESEPRGLTEAGRAAVAELNENRIIIDVSHLSDGGVDDILSLSSAPIVASHSNSRRVCAVSRNLTDRHLKAIADKGGAVGLNFCRDFVIGGAVEDALNSTHLTDGESVFEWLYRHYLHVVQVGGEDLPALGSDFDGITRYEEMSDCLCVPGLLEYFSRRGVKSRALEKLAYGNFARVFGEVVG